MHGRIPHKSQWTSPLVNFKTHPGTLNQLSITCFSIITKKNNSQNMLFTENYTQMVDNTLSCLPRPEVWQILFAELYRILHWHHLFHQSQNLIHLSFQRLPYHLHPHHLPLLHRHDHWLPEFPPTKHTDIKAPPLFHASIIFDYHCEAAVFTWHIPNFLSIKL